MHSYPGSAARSITVEVMIRAEGVVKLRGHPRHAVFNAVLDKANWPAVAGVRIGPEEDVLVEGGRVRAELHLPGLTLSVAGVVTEFEPGASIEAAGVQRGVFATMLVRFTDNVDDPPGNDSAETTLTWQFEARLPYRLKMLERPAAAAIKASIPVLEARFIANIIKDLNHGLPVDGGPHPDAIRHDGAP